VNIAQYPITQYQYHSNPRCKIGLQELNSLAQDCRSRQQDKQWTPTGAGHMVHEEEEEEEECLIYQ